MASFLNQTRRRFIASAALATVVVAITFVALSNTRLMLWLENGSYDARVRLLDRQLAHNTSVAQRASMYVIIDIDNASFDTLKEQFGRWPWSRQVWTEVVRYVNKGQPKVMAIDIIFGGEETPEIDQRFATVMQRSGKVVLGYSFSPTEMDRVEDAASMQKRATLERMAAPVEAQAIGEAVSAKEFAFNVPLDSFAAASAGMGAINTIPDSDGVIRRAAVQYLMDGKAYPSFAARISEVASGLPRTAFQSRGQRLAGRGEVTIPTDDQGRMLISWRVRTAEAQRLPFWQVICSIYPANCPAQVVKYPPEYFKDKIVLLGASASASYDAHNLPLGEQLPGFIIQVNAVEDLLRGEAVRVPGRWVAPVLIVLMAIAGCAVLVLVSSSTFSTMAGIALMAIYAGVSVLLFNSQHLWLPMASPLSAFAAAFFAAASIRYATTGRELRRTRGTLDRYISPQLVNYVLEHRDSINLAGQKKELSILFSDVRNFTTMTESADPMELIATLNEYLEAMTEVIFKYDGITDKFIGDGILAYWGAFTPGKNHAELSSRAALEMLEKLEELNQMWRSQGRKELAIGIGINTGEVVFGNVGSGRKIEFTVIGDAVNLAARLESQTKEYGVKTIISEFTRARLGEEFAVRSLGGVKVKGKTVETAIYELQSVTSTPAAEELAGKVKNAH